MKAPILIFLLLILAGNGFSQDVSGFLMSICLEDSCESDDFQLFSSENLALKYLDSINQYFESNGFLQLYIIKEKISADSLRAKIQLGKQFAWEALDYKAIPVSFLPVSEPKASYSEVNSWMQQVILNAENIGYPFAQIKLDSVERMGNMLSGSISFDVGPLIRWDSLEVEGNTKTQARYLQNLLKINPGDLFSQKKLNEATQILLRSPYFTLISPPSVTFQIQKARPTFSIRDRNSNVIDGIIGLIPNENDPGKMLITGQLNLELYHLGGKGRDVLLNWKRINVETQSLEISAKESYLFNSHLDVSLGFSLLKQDTTFLNRFFKLEFGYQMSNSGYLRFFTKRQAADLISSYAYREAEELPDVADYRWNQYGVGVVVDRVDSRYFPRRGLLLEGEFAAGNKQILQNTGVPAVAYEGVDMNSPQYLGNVSLEKHIYIRPTWGMWMRGSGGFTKNKNLLLNDLFRLGGLKTLRGFNENYFYASRYGYLNLEQRLFFGENSFLLVFADLGILENPYFAPQIDKPISFGTGINLDTGTGLFQFIFGVGKSNLQPLQFSYSRIHFGYKARF